MFSLFVYLILYVASSILSYLLRPRIPKPQTAKWEQPRTEIGEPIPIGFGTFEVSPNIVIVGPLKEHEYTDPDNFEVMEYWGKMVGSLCHGPVDTWVDWRYGDQSVRLANPKWKYKTYTSGLVYKGFLSKPMPIDRPISGLRAEQFVGLPKLFEGGKKQGGIAGPMHLHWGTFDDDVCCLVRELYGDDDASRFPGVCYVTFGWAGDADGSVLEMQLPWTMHFGSLDADASCVLGGDASLCHWGEEPDGSSCGWYPGYSPYQGGLVWPSTVRAILDHNRWGIPLGSAHACIYGEVRVTGLAPGATATIEFDIQRTAHGSGGLLGASTTYIGVWWGYQMGSAGREEIGTSLHGAGFISPSYIASGAIQHHSIQATADGNGEFILKMGTWSAEYGEQDYRIQWTNLSVTPDNPGSGCGEQWDGPYRNWGDIGGLRQANYFYFGANNPNPTGPTFILQRWPVGLVENRIGDHANIAACIYEILTNTRWGLAEPPTLIDIATFEDCAEVLASEGLGVSFLMTDEREVEDWLAELLSVADAVIYTDILDGLLKMKLVRADYDTSTVLALRESDVDKVEVSRIEVPELVGEVQVRYKRYWEGNEGPQIDEVLTNHLRVIGSRLGWPGGNGTRLYAFLKLRGSNVTNVVIKQGIVEWVLGTDYRLNWANGLVVVTWTPTGNVVLGEPVLATYNAAPKFIGYKEDAETLQNLAVWMANNGHVRKEDVEYGMIGTQASAKQIVNRMLQSGSQLLRSIELECNRRMSRLHPGSVFTVPSLDRDLANVVWRVGKISYGKLSEATMIVEAVEDLFATDGLINIPTDPDGDGSGGDPATGELPALAAFYQQDDSSIRVAFQAVETLYNVEIQRSATVYGTSPTTITPTDGVPGTDTYFDDPQTIGVSYWYRGRQIDPTGAVTASPWTAWIEMVGVSGTPGTPTFVAPTIIATPTDDGLTATLTLTAVDPQNRLIGSEFQTKVGNGEASEWTEDDTLPYIAEADLVGGSTTSITYKAYYVDDGGETVTLSDTHYWNAVWDGETGGGSGVDSIVTTEGAAPDVVLDEAGDIVTTEM